MDEELIKEWTEELLSGNMEQDEAKEISYRFDLDLFARLQHTFIIATGLNGNIVDRTGKALTPEFLERSPKFCRMVQSSPEGRQRCYKSDQRATKYAISQEKVAICRCHAGIYDSAVPIHFQQHGLGAFITGQVLLQPPTEEMVEDIWRRVADLDLDKDELIEAIHHIPQITVEKLKATTEFMKILADYIVKSLEEAEFKRREAEWRSLLRETEMKVIQSKLRPHFLFNILNLLSGQALLENASQTYTTVSHLTKLLRNIVKPSRPLVRLEEELGNLDSYVQLQVLRFEDKVSFHMQFAEPGLKKVLVPSLTLQILVENAFKHGIEPKVGRCHIHLRIFSRGERLVIEIEDNGVGMEAEKLEELNSGKGEFGERLSGISMVRKRFEYHFNQNYDLCIRSRQGEGTTVSIEIPIMKS